MTQPPGPGWYQDPEGGPSLRWWDGRQWTSATHPAEAATTSSDPEPAPDELARPTPDKPLAAGNRRNKKIAAGAAGVIALLVAASFAFGDRETENENEAQSTTTETESATPTTTPYRDPHLPRVSTTTPPLITRPTTTLRPTGAPKPAQSPAEAGCDEPDAGILSAIEASLTEDRYISEVAAVTERTHGVDYTYTAGNVYNPDGSRSVSSVVWVTPGFGVMGLSSNSRKVSTLPFGRDLLDISAGDDAGVKVQDCVQALALGR